MFASSDFVIKIKQFVGKIVRTVIEEIDDVKTKDGREGTVVYIFNMADFARGISG